METAEELSWRKSSYSSSNGGNCVEVSVIPAAIAVRDSKNPNGPALIFGHVNWQAFYRHVQMNDKIA